MAREVPEGIAASLFSVLPLLNERGLDSVSIGEIANAAGIPRATLYYHFSGRDEILAFVLADVVRRVDDAVSQAVAAGGPDGRSRLELVVRAVAEAVARDVAPFSVLMANLGRAGRVSQITEAVDRIIRRPIAAIIREGISDGSLAPVDADLAAISVYAMTTSLAIWQDVRGQPVTEDGLTRQITELLVEGLAAR